MTPGKGDPACPHATRDDHGVCVACGHCIHDVILNGTCVYCGEVDPPPVSLKLGLIPADRLRRK